MENSTKEERNKQEEIIIEQYFDNQNSCYNFKQKTAGKDRTVYSNTPQETFKLISDNSKNQWQKPEHQEFIKAVAKYYGKIQSPSGEILEVYNCKQFSKDHSLNSKRFNEFLLSSKLSFLNKITGETWTKVNS